MSTYYEILGVSETASASLIKKNFHELIIAHHPDKASKYKNANRAQQILKAWEVLRDVESRKKYDNDLESQRNQQDRAIGAEVDLDDMEYNELDKSFSLECRCSGKYRIVEDELENDIDIVGCDNCSLYIRVLYDVVDEE